MEEDGLPRGWAKVRLGDVLPLFYGKALTEKHRDTAGDVPVFGSSGVVGRHSVALTHGSSIIVGRKGSVGQVFYSPVPCWPIDTVYYVQGTASTNLKFFTNLLTFLDLGQLDKSTAVPGLSRDDYNALIVAVPPLPEQHRIVAEIETQFTRLDAAVAALKRAQVNLKRYRASVLAAACSGRLVPTEAELARAEGREYEPADQLLARILEERRAMWEADQLARMQTMGKVPRDDKWKSRYPTATSARNAPDPNLPEGWVAASVGQVSVVVRGASPRPAGDPRFFGGHIPWITVGVLTADEQPYLTEVKETVTEAGRQASRYVKPGTLLLTNSGATLGVPKITRIGGCINDGSVALLYLHDPTKLYLYYFLRTQTLVLRAINQGAAQSNLNTTLVKNIIVPLPPLAEQHRIVAEVERRLSVVEEMETAVEHGLKRAERLRQAILKRAFEGKLVLQDPSDEPASVLLERIRAERAGMDQGSRNGRGRGSARRKGRAEAQPPLL